MKETQLSIENPIHLLIIIIFLIFFGFNFLLVDYKLNKIGLSLQFLRRWEILIIPINKIKSIESNQKLFYNPFRFLNLKNRIFSRGLIIETSDMFIRYFLISPVNEFEFLQKLIDIRESDKY